MAILLSLLSAASYVLFIHDFVPSEAVFWTTLSMSGLLSLGVALWLTRGISRKTWVPGEDFSTYSRKKKAFTLVSCLVVLFFAIWINTGYLIPRALTRLAGSAADRSLVVTAKQDHGRRRTCDYALDSRQLRSLFFKLCIDPAFHAASPQGEFRVRIRTRDSALGFIAEGVSRSPSAPWPTGSR